jgi:DNA-binding NtrC family response regulator
MNSTKISIVLIDDEVDLCVLLSAMLSSYGFDVSYYHTIAEGLGGVKEKQPNWVIIDNNLPDGLGWDKTNEILDMAPEVNIIKISANPDSKREKHRDFIHYLIKPINVNSVVKLINAPH